MSIPFVYLDIPISANPRRMETWESIINFFDKKLASWKHKHLSFAGRVCLINLVLLYPSSFIFFFFFNFRRNFQEIGKDSKRFLWGFEDGIEKISWVGCEKICCPKEDGRLGVKDISLLAKWR